MMCERRKDKNPGFFFIVYKDICHTYVKGHKTRAKSDTMDINHLKSNVKQFLIIIYCDIV